VNTSYAVAINDAGHVLGVTNWDVSSDVFLETVHLSRRNPHPAHAARR
jgi:hypothetical protein